MTKKTNPFHFKQFSVFQDKAIMKVGTDGVLLGAWAGVSEETNTILDIGAGAGLIALMLAQRVEGATIHAVEIEEQSYLQSKGNFENSPWADRLHIHHSSIQEYESVTRAKFDLIISNPPFFSGGTFSDSNQRNNVRHTVKLPHGDLLRVVRSMLSENGRFALILPYIEGLRFCEMAETYNLFCTKMQEVIPKVGKPTERLLMEFSTTKSNACQEMKPLIIQNEAAHDWTGDYIELTKAFYLKM